MKLAITGSRRWRSIRQIQQNLDEIAPSLIIHGGAMGADSIADAWARARGVAVAVVRPARAEGTPWMGPKPMKGGNAAEVIH